MSLSLDIMSDIITYMKYAKFNPEINRKEIWKEVIDRNKNMHIKKFPNLKNEIEKHYKLVYEKKVFPSMRSLQFAGDPVEKNNIRLYNCSYLPIDSVESFSEILYILLCGTGAGFSVQPHHIGNLPEIKKPKKTITETHVIGDSIEEWADSILVLLKSYFKNKEKIEIYDESKIKELSDDISNINNIKSIMKKVDFDDFKPNVVFDYSKIRSKGSLIKSSMTKAPGPDGLRQTHEEIKKILDTKKNGERLTSLECHDIVCHIANCVLSGGVRRSSLISFFDPEDNLMLTCKNQENYDFFTNKNLQRANANNTAVFYRPELTKEMFDKFFNEVSNSFSGEPGIMLTNDPDKNINSNPCAEISLNPFQFCNLCEVVSKDIKDKQDFLDRVKAASFIGTLQASYTDFPYIRKQWQDQTKEEALLGIGITGLASGDIDNEWFEEAAKLANDYNKEISQLIGINPAARVTTVKPSGTSSLVAGTSSGVHTWHAPYYIRRIRVLENEAIFKYLNKNHPELIQSEDIRDKNGKYVDTMHTINIPVKAPEKAILNTETEIEFLERVKFLHENWIKPGHNSGQNTHNVSCTVYVKDWDIVREWMWENKDYYTAISLLPYFEENSTLYKQLPHETISKEKYEELYKTLKQVDLTKIEDNDFKSFELELACVGGACEI